MRGKFFKDFDGLWQALVGGALIAGTIYHAADLGSLAVDLLAGGIPFLVFPAEKDKDAKSAADRLAILVVGAFKSFVALFVLNGVLLLIWAIFSGSWSLLKSLFSFL
jgi:hypothetical protein